MGRAHILVDPSLLLRMEREPVLQRAVTIIGQPTPFGDGYYQLHVESPQLPDDPPYHGQLYLIANPGEPPRFKSDTDT